MERKKSLMMIGAVMAIVAGSAFAFSGYNPAEQQAAKPITPTVATPSAQATPPAPVTENPRQKPFDVVGCKTSEAQIIDDWKGAGGDFGYEQMALSIEDGKRVFRTWLHERPEIADGTWTFDTCILTLYSDSGSVKADRFVVDIQTSQSMTLIEISDDPKNPGRPIIYDRVK